MSPPPLQATRFEQAQRRLASVLFNGFRGSWRRRSLVLLALLVGFYGGQNVTVLWLERLNNRPLVVLVLVMLIELAIRLRTTLAGDRPALGWLLLDNLRVGLVYAVVLEAFKLGS